MNYLLDTNIWLERMLDQAKTAEVAELLTRVPADRLGMTDFTLHSIGVILNRLKQRPTFVRFVQDVLLDGLVELLTVPPDAMAELTTPSKSSAWTLTTPISTSLPNATI